MVPDPLSSLVGLCAASLAIALSLPPIASADPPSWNGVYAITFIVGPKSGTSMAAGDPEVQYTDTYTFRSRFRNRFNSPGMGRPGRKSAISNGTA
jgi:hypothetical protein